MIIGPSTGWLYAAGIYPPAEQEKVLREAGATGLEICLSGEQRRIDSLMGKQQFGEFAYKSLHISDYDEFKPLEEQVSLAKEIIGKHKIMNALIHPLFVPQTYFEKAAEENIPLAIENMDKNKPAGYKIEELEQLITSYNLHFVFDVQHAYEHDPAMGYAKELFEMAKGRIVHLHVSGEADDSNHSLVHKSRNSGRIVDFLGRIFSEIQVPIILEGEYKTAGELRRELDFLNQNITKQQTL